jgi:lipid-A-disaccharide kinase (EC 2.7.1.130)
VTLRQTLEQQWQEGGALATALRPLGALTGKVAWWRRRHIQGRAASIPTIVVGNLAVGGSGKTPLVAALARQLTAAGWRVAIISRGYGARPPHWPYRVRRDDSPQQAGDEPLLLAQEQEQTQAVYLCPDRHRAIAAAAADGHNLALLDDGFQHLALQPSLRLLVFSGPVPWAMAIASLPAPCASARTSCSMPMPCSWTPPQQQPSRSATGHPVFFSASSPKTSSPSTIQAAPAASTVCRDST